MREVGTVGDYLIISGHFCEKMLGMGTKGWDFWTFFVLTEEVDAIDDEGVPSGFGREVKVGVGRYC
jgi:hypothetical protein